MKNKKEPNKAKKKEVEVLKKVLNKYKTIGIIDLTNLPSPQLQAIRKKLEGEIRVTKKRLLKVALKDVDKGVEKLEGDLKGVMPALILTNENSFKLAKFLRKNRSQIAAKGGQIAPKDIVVSAGPIGLPPGPIIGELGGAGIRASVEQGKVTVKDDCTVVKQGQVIKNNVANILTKLGIKPMEIGLNLVATYENGTIFRKEVLDVDDMAYINKLKEIFKEAMNLSVKIGYITKDNIQLVLIKAEREAKGLEKLGEEKFKNQAENQGG